MKQFLLILTCCAAGCITLQIGERFQPGIFNGEAQGYHGMVYVAVETDKSSIVNIEITKHSEDEWTGGEAMHSLLEQVLAEDSTDIDAISGATFSSEAFLRAVDNALEKARLHAFQKRNTDKL